MSVGTAAVASWIRRFRPVPHPRVRLLCLPHAGGTASAYRAWPQWLPSDVELLAARYPGREDRLTEPSARSMQELVAALSRVVESLSDQAMRHYQRRYLPSGARLAGVTSARFLAPALPPARVRLACSVVRHGDLVKVTARVSRAEQDIARVRLRYTCHH